MKRLSPLEAGAFSRTPNAPFSFAPGMLIEGAQHRERHRLTPGFDGRLRHRREQWRMIGRRPRAGSFACRGHPFWLVDADVEKHRGHPGIDEFGKILTGRPRRRGPKL